MKILGWLGSFLLGIAAVPQLFKVLRDGHAQGMAWGYVLLLWAGFGTMAVFTNKTKAALQLRVSYTFQWLVFSTILLVKILGGD